MSFLKKNLKKTLFLIGIGMFSLLGFVVKAFFYIILEVISDNDSDDISSGVKEYSNPADDVTNLGLDYHVSKTLMDTKDVM